MEHVRSELVDVLRRPGRYPRSVHARALTHVQNMLAEPMSPAEAAEEFGVSKPTVLGWVRDGYLAEAPGSRRTRIRLDRAEVYMVADLLDAARDSGAGRDAHHALVHVLRQALAALPEDAALRRDLGSPRAHIVISDAEKAQIIKATRTRARRSAPGITDVRTAARGARQEGRILVSRRG